MGLLQANEVIKLVIGMGEPLVGRLLLFEALIDAVHAAEGAPRRRGLPDLRRRRRPREHGVRGLRGALRGRRLGFRAAMATVKIPPVLRPAVSGMSEVEVDGRDRRRGPATASPASTRTRAASSSPTTGELNRFVNVYVNDEDVRVQQGLETGVAAGDTVVILPAMAGGQR